jgi:hypothetical protein
MLVYHSCDVYPSEWLFWPFKLVLQPKQSGKDFALYYNVERMLAFDWPMVPNSGMEMPIGSY